MLNTTTEEDCHNQNDAVHNLLDNNNNRISINVDRAGAFTLPISATIVMRSNNSPNSNEVVVNQRKKTRYSRLGFRALVGVKIRRRISKQGFVPVVAIVVSVFILLMFVLISALAPSPADLSLIQRAEDLRSAVFNVPASGGSLERDLWRSKSSDLYYGCCNASDKYQEQGLNTYPDRYLLIVTSGGLNQQRTGITDAVVAARILNATLIVPKLDQHSFWKDKSNFSEIFDVDRFISYLSKDIKIIKQLPAIETGHKLVSMRVPRKCSQNCYQAHVLPVLRKRKVIQLSKFDYRLANRLDSDLQKLRCKVNYHALKFTDPIHQFGQMLVQRMRMKSKHYIALHLRFEPDMLAFSGCYYGGGEKEMRVLGSIRKRWKSLHKSNPEKERRHGRCPLTPEEVGLMLRALGYGSDVHIYVASGEIYGGEETLKPLKALFPNFHSKETIASEAELAPFESFSSRMAALDFMVCDESDVFVTNNNGNMAKILAGRRRYFGHKPTIRPNAKKLYKLFLNKNNMTWEEFASRVRSSQIGFMGEPNEVRPGRGEFHENPAACICAKSESGTNDKDSQKGNSTFKEEQSFTDDDDQDTDDDQDIDAEYLHSKISTNTVQSFINIVKSHEPQLEVRNSI